jgi:membrane fusion protein, multidrug efflux system
MKHYLFKITGILVGFIMITGINACQSKEPPSVETIRAIKTITVESTTEAGFRKFPGVVHAVENSTTSFEIAGNVQKVLVFAGDRVKKGQLLATLDPLPFRLKEEAAEAELTRAKIDLDKQEKNFSRFRNIAQQDPGAISLSTLEQAEAGYESGKQNVVVAQSQLNLARRDLQKTDLVAPFDGIIAKRYVDAFMEVNRGQPIFDIFVGQDMEIFIYVPEVLIGYVNMDMKADVVFPDEPELRNEGMVSEISSVAGQAGTFPVKILLSGTNERIRPGMSAEVKLKSFSRQSQGEVTLPIHAFTTGKGKAEAYVFVYDQQTSTVKKVPVETRGGFDNNVIITQGIKPGDIVAIAGVSFLTDGQKVKLMSRQ